MDDLSFRRRHNPRYLGGRVGEVDQRGIECVEHEVIEHGSDVGNGIVVNIAILYCPATPNNPFVTIRVCIQSVESEGSIFGKKRK